MVLNNDKKANDIVINKKILKLIINDKRRIKNGECY